MIYLPSVPSTPLKQAELISNLPQFILSPTSFNSQDEKVLNERTHKWAIILTQDCDLEWDFKTRNEQSGDENKLIPSVLICEVTTAQELKSGPSMNSEIWKLVRQNKNERYQFLQSIKISEDLQNEGVPELAIDFKRYFTIPTDELYSRFAQNTKRRCYLNAPYSQHLVARFFYFQSRIGLPEPHFSEPT